MRDALRDTTTTIAPPAAVRVPGSVATAGCNDASLSVPAADRVAALRVLAKTASRWVADATITPEAGGAANPSLSVAVKPINADSFATTNDTLASGSIPGVDSLGPEPASDDGTWATAASRWRQQHAAAAQAAGRLATALSSSQPPPAEWSDLLGCLAAGADWLNSQPASRRVLVFSSDFEFSGTQNLSSQVSLTGIEFVGIQSCSSAAAECDSARSQFSTVLSHLGAGPVIWSRADDLSPALAALDAVRQKVM